MEVNMQHKRILKIMAVCLLAVSLLSIFCSCSNDWTDKDISKSHTIKITKFNNDFHDTKVIYTITDQEIVTNLCSTFSNLELSDARKYANTKWAFHIEFLGTEQESLFVCEENNVIIGNHGDKYRITNIDIKHYLNEMIKTAPSRITRDPEEDYHIFMQFPADDSTCKQGDVSPVFVWRIANESSIPKKYILEIDYLNDGSYMTITCQTPSHVLKAEDWETIKNDTPTVNGVKKVQWRIRVDPYYHTDLEPYYTEWCSFYITEN